MSLIEGEIIRDIVQLDEGWWQGVSEDGTRSGLFPGILAWIRYEIKIFN